MSTIIDDTVEVSAGDGFERESSGAMNITANFVQNIASKNNYGRYWGAYKFPDIDIPIGSTIIAAYIELYVYATSTDDANINLHFQKIAAPADLTTTAFDITGRTRTTLSRAWVEASVAAGGYNYYGSAYSLVAALQELVNAYTTDGVIVITRPNTLADGDELLYCYSYDNASPVRPPKFHVEFTPPAGVVGLAKGYIIG